MFFAFSLCNDKYGLSESKIRNITYIIHWSLLIVLSAFSFSTSLGSPVIGRQHFNVLRRFEISQKSCNGFDNIKPGVCMFNFQCHQRGGKVIGTCIDGFLFGACCSLSIEALEAMLNENENNTVGLTSVNDLKFSDKSKVTSTTKPDHVNNLSTSSQASVNDNKIVISTSRPNSVTEKYWDGASSTSFVTKIEIASNLISTTSSATELLSANAVLGNVSKTLSSKNYSDLEYETTTISSITNSYKRKASIKNEFLSATTSAGNLLLDESFKTEIYQNEISTTLSEGNYLGEGFEDQWDLISYSNVSTVDNKEFNGYEAVNSSTEIEFSENDLFIPTENSTLLFLSGNYDNDVNTLPSTTTIAPTFGTIQESLFPTTHGNINSNNDNMTFTKSKTNSSVKDSVKLSTLDNNIIPFNESNAVTPQKHSITSTIHHVTTAENFNAVVNPENNPSTASIDVFSQTGEIISTPYSIEKSTMKNPTFSTIMMNKLTLKPESMLLESTTQEPLLFWTTRGPPTRRPLRPGVDSSNRNETDFSDFNIESINATSEATLIAPMDHLAFTSESNTYEILLQKIANNILQNNDIIWETSSESWASSTYPIIIKNTTNNLNKNDPLFVQIPNLEALENAISKDNASSNGSYASEATTKPFTTVITTNPFVDSSSIIPSSDDIGHNVTSSMSEVKPPIDLNILVQLLNLTSYIPDDDMFIPSDHLPIHEISSNELEETNPFVTMTTTTVTTTLPTTTSPMTTTTRPTTTTSTTTTTATTTRKIWNWKTTCGIRPLVREGRIVNGRRSDFGEWPWQALVRESTWLGIFTKNKCGGVLLNSKYVITAAHCQPGFLASLIVVLGELDVSDDYEPKKTIQKNVKRVVVHKDFIARTFDNDLALLELESPVEFDEHIVPICMPQGDRNFVGSYGYVSGWGRLSYQGSIPNLLHNVEVPVIPNEECQTWFKEAGHTKTIKPEFICAGYKNGKKDSCEGDSGGPLSIRGDDGRWILAGIVSHGIKCAYPNLPGVYMRMSYYKPWIDKIIHS